MTTNMSNRDSLAKIASDWLMEHRTSNQSSADEQGRGIADAIQEAGYRKVEVTDDMVERAVQAFASDNSGRIPAVTMRYGMRAALAAALGGDDA